MNYSRLS